ncbi:MAG TPA: nucleotide exchange factor GrpE [Candidatus Nanoarchaeia archaeon]|nr:nucleotide exchange factor GrpE [Candidatus Nanoarchaeia archaeon]
MTNKKINQDKSEEAVNPELQPENHPDELAEMKDLLQRTQANFENYRKQVDKRVEEIRDMAAKDVILQLLPVLDNLELALKSADKNLVEFKKGIELIYSQLFSILENQGVTVIEAKKFDPYLHEPLLKVESDAPENAILEEFQKGFMLNNRVIRHAKVKLSAGKKKAVEKENNANQTQAINPEIKK